MLITLTFCGFAVYSTWFQKFMENAPILAVFALLANITTLIMLACSKEMARKVPTNYILLFTFTVTEAYIVGVICSETEPRIVMIAWLLTAGITLSLFMYALTTKTDFTFMGGFLFLGSTALFLGALCIYAF